MSLRFSLRAIFVSTAAVAVLATPAYASGDHVATAKAPKAAIAKKTGGAKKLSERAGRKPRSIETVARRSGDSVSTTADGLGTAIGIGPSTMLTAMTTAVKAAPAFFAGHTTGCAGITAMLASAPGQVLAGNFRDDAGNCYVWLNLNNASSLSGSEICKTTLHELGHLNGLAHSKDISDVMYSPFDSTTMPAPCQAHRR